MSCVIKEDFTEAVTNYRQFLSIIIILLLQQIYHYSYENYNDVSTLAHNVNVLK